MAFLLRKIQYLSGPDYILTRGDILVQDGLLVLDPPSPTATEVLDGEDYFAIPGFTNAHCHLFDGALKEQWTGRTIPELFGPQGEKARYLQSASDEELEVAARGFFQQMLHRGFTTIGAFVEEGKRGLKIASAALKGLPLNAILLGRPESNQPTPSDIEALLAMGDGLAPSSATPFANEILAQMSRQTREQTKLVATHMAEAKPSSNLPRTLQHYCPHFLVHGNYFSPSELEEIARAQVGMVVCIRSGSSFGHRPPNLAELDRLQIPFGLGTDNPLANSPDPFRELEYISRYFTGETQNQWSITSERLLRAATRDGAQLLHQTGRGTIEDKGIADLVILKKDSELNPLVGAASVIYRASSHHIYRIVAGGEVVIPLAPVIQTKNESIFL